MDAQTLMQSGVAEQVAAASPTVAAQLGEALQTGGQIDAGADELLAQHRHLPIRQPDAHRPVLLRGQVLQRQGGAQGLVFGLLQHLASTKKAHAPVVARGHVRPAAVRHDGLSEAEVDFFEHQSEGFDAQLLHLVGGVDQVVGQGGDQPVRSLFDARGHRVMMVLLPHSHRVL